MGEQFVPLAKIVGGIFIFRGTVKFIFGFLRFKHRNRQADKNIFYYLLLVKKKINTNEKKG